MRFFRIARPVIKLRAKLLVHDQLPTWRDHTFHRTGRRNRHATLRGSIRADNNIGLGKLGERIGYSCRLRMSATLGSRQVRKRFLVAGAHHIQHGSRDGSVSDRRCYFDACGNMSRIGNDQRDMSQLPVERRAMIGQAVVSVEILRDLK